MGAQYIIICISGPPMAAVLIWCAWKEHREARERKKEIARAIYDLDKKYEELVRNFPRDDWE